MRPYLDELPPSRGASFLYRTRLGGFFLRLFASRALSRAAGAFCDSVFSKPLVKGFVKRHGISLDEYLPETYRSFNAFFTRRIRPELRPADPNPDALLAPCDGLVSVFPVTETGTFRVKGFDYTVSEFLRDEELARHFLGGLCMIFRLTVSDYHRYIFPADGRRGESRFIRGRLHTVRPVALGSRRVFAENCREITLLHTDRFGDLVQAEVGAMFVGRIVNEDKPVFSRGEEKGRFEYGGSTIVLLSEAGKIRLDGEFFENTALGRETKVLCGEKIGSGV